MNDVKTAVFVLVVAAYTSCWWAAALGLRCDTWWAAYPAFVALFGALGVVVWVGSVISNHWDDKPHD